MPKNFKCSFCGKNFNSTTGMMHVRNDGTLLYFCSRRCRISSLSFGRDSRKLKWTAYYGKREKGR
jgi:large subunit ribosomal protein L24e